MKRVAISQSNYIPWKGYFDLIHDVDVFVFLDDVQFAKNDWRNRNPNVNGGNWNRNGGNWQHHGGNGSGNFNDAWRRYHHDHHDRNWWHAHYPRIALINNGYYYWDTGWWYPAWGYDSAYNYYAYDGPIYGYGDLPPDQAGVLALLAKVEFLAQAVLELADHLHHAVAGTERGVFRREARHLVQDLDVDLDPLAYTRPLDFDRHLVAVAQDGLVNLRHRGGGERLAAERLEQFRNRRAQLGLDDPDDLVGRDRGNRALKAHQGVDIARRHDIRACAQELAELDETGS